MKKGFVIGLSVALSLFASAVFAVPTLLGGTGGILVPNTNVQQGKSIDVSVQDNADYGYNLYYTSVPNTILTVGVSKNLEVGVQYQTGDGDVSQNFNAKYATGLGNDLRGAVGMQIGKDDVYFVYDGGDYQNYYGAISSDRLIKGSTVTAALLCNKVEGHKAIAFPAVTVEKTLNSGAKLGVELLLGPKDDGGRQELFEGFRHGSVYVDIPVGEELTVRGGFYGIADAEENAGTLYLGVNYLFDNGNMKL